MKLDLKIIENSFVSRGYFFFFQISEKCEQIENERENGAR